MPPPVRPEKTRGSDTVTTTRDFNSAPRSGAADAASVHERIAEELCVWPSAQDFAALRNVAPKVAGEIGMKLIDQAGGGLSIVEGKADASR